MGGRLSLSDLSAAGVAAGSLNGARLVVLGAGRTGLEVAEFAAAHGALVTLHDSAEAETLMVAAGRLATSGVTLAFGAAAELAPLLATADLVVHSPSVPL
ncbi:MAG: NAD-binding protein, partial [Chloroflexota bacterium]